jgi:hypothetical protein
VISEELRHKYEEAVRNERTAWVALANASDADTSYTAIKAVWKAAAQSVAELAAEMQAQRKQN